MDALETAALAGKFATPAPAQLSAWYRDHLGFTRHGVIDDGRYAIVSRGSIKIHFWQCDERRIAEHTACYITLASCTALDRLHAEWLDAAQRPSFHPGRLERSPQDKHGHGMREFHVWDPAGNLIGLGADL